MERAEREPLRIAVVLGSVRANRLSSGPARLICDRAAAAGHRTELLDLRVLQLPMYGFDAVEAENDPAILAFRHSLAKAEAVVWLTPEYNHSFTSAIKNAIEYLEDEPRRKPSAVCGVSIGPFGGVRAVEQLKQVLFDLQSVPIRDSVHFTHADTMFDAEGGLLRPEFIRRVDAMLAELAWYALALLWGRANLP